MRRPRVPRWASQSPVTMYRIDTTSDSARPSVDAGKTSYDAMLLCKQENPGAETFLGMSA